MDSQAFDDRGRGFEVTTFLVIVDQLSSALTRRIAAYSVMKTRFSFLSNFGSMAEDQLVEAASRLVQAYPSDLSNDFPAEFRQFARWYQDRFPLVGEKRCDAKEMYTVIANGVLGSTFPDTAVALRIYTSLMITNCSGERSFSYPKKVKNECRSIM